MSLFRYMLRLTYEEGSGSIDDRLVTHLDSLSAVSANRKQEWIRNALRNAFIQEERVIMGVQAEINERGRSQSEV